MVAKLDSNCYRFGERRDNDQRFELQGGGHHLFAEESEIIPISAPNPFVLGRGRDASYLAPPAPIRT